jgi:hypothetical protein
MCWFGLTRWAYSRPYFLFIGGPSSLDSDTWPVLVKTRTPPPAAHSLAWTPWLEVSFAQNVQPVPAVSPACPTRRHVPTGRLARKFLPRGTTRDSPWTPGSPGFAPGLKRHPAPSSPSNPGFTPQVELNPTTDMAPKCAAPAPHDMSSRGNWGGPLPLGPGCGEG